MDKKSFYKLVDGLLILLGLFLIVDRLHLHWIRFDYAMLGLGWLDPWFDHWMIGLFLIAVAAWDLRSKNKE